MLAQVITDCYYYYNNNTMNSSIQNYIKLRQQRQQHNNIQVDNNGNIDDLDVTELESGGGYAISVKGT